jgi:hypothetical protein
MMFDLCLKTKMNILSSIPFLNYIHVITNIGLLEVNKFVLSSKHPYWWPWLCSTFIRLFEFVYYIFFWDMQICYTRNCWIFNVHPLLFLTNFRPQQSLKMKKQLISLLVQVQVQVQIPAQVRDEWCTWWEITWLCAFRIRPCC